MSSVQVNFRCMVGKKQYHINSLNFLQNKNKKNINNNSIMNNKTQTLTAMITIKNTLLISHK